jgi:hypothetical protein
VPRIPLPDVGVTFIRETCTPPPGTLLPVPSSYGLIRQSSWLSSPSALHLVRGVSAGCCQPLLPPGPSRRYLGESFLGCLSPYPGRLLSAFAWFRTPGPIRPTCRHSAISPQSGLYALPSLCGSASATDESVTLLVAEYHYDGSWALPSAGLPRRKSS